jgi:hypothetical protein
MIDMQFEKAKLYIQVAIEPLNTKTPVHVLTRSIRKKCYSLLYNDIVEYSTSRSRSLSDQFADQQATASKPSITVIEVVYNQKRQEEQQHQERIEVNVTVNAAREYSITNLWMQDISVRGEYFFKCMNSKEVIEMCTRSNTFVWTYKLPCLVLRYLIKENRFLTENELKAFILTFLNSDKHIRLDVSIIVFVL